MAFPVNKILVTDKLKEIRTKYNELIDALENFSFEDGDLFFTGSINQTEERVLVNEGETGAGSVGKLPGLEVDEGTETNKVIVWDTDDDKWKVGTLTSLTALSLEGHNHDTEYYTQTIIDALLAGIDFNGGNVTTKNLTLRDSTNPTGLLVHNTYTDSTHYERGKVKFEDDTLKIGVEQQNGDLPEMGFVQTGLMKFYSHQATVNDDASFTLPVISNSAWGFIVIGSDMEHSMFTIDSSGNVTLISSSANVLANVDTDANLCIGTSVSSPVVIKNRLGDNYNVNLIVFYS